MSLKSKLGDFGKAMIKLFAHPAINYAIDNTVVKMVEKTEIKTDDYIVETFIRPKIHALFDKAISGFSNISPQKYLLDLRRDVINNINSIETINILILDLETQKKALQKKKETK